MKIFLKDSEPTQSKYKAEWKNLIDSNILNKMDYWLESNIVGQHFNKSNLQRLLFEWEDFLHNLNLHSELVRLYSEDLKIKFRIQMLELYPNRNSDWYIL